MYLEAGGTKLRYLNNEEEIINRTLHIRLKTHGIRVTLHAQGLSLLYFFSDNTYMNLRPSLEPWNFNWQKQRLGAL